MEERCAQHLINPTWDSCVVTVFELLQGAVIHNNSITQRLNLGFFKIIINQKDVLGYLKLEFTSSQRALKKKGHFSEKHQQQKLGHNHRPLAQRKKLRGLLEESRLA